MTKFGSWGQYKKTSSTYTPNQPPLSTNIEKFVQPCLIEQCAEKIRKQRGLPPGTMVPVMISCPCPKCSPRMQ